MMICGSRCECCGFYIGRCNPPHVLTHSVQISCPRLRYIGTTMGYNVPSVNSHVRDIAGVLVLLPNARVIAV